MDSAELINSCRVIKLNEKEERRVSFKNKMKAKGKKIVASCLYGRKISFFNFKLGSISYNT